MDTPLHQQDPTGRFSGRAESYARFRPDYPEALIEAILEGMGEPDSLVVADIGAGTGISARAFATRGARVIAIEPNDAMRAAATPVPRVDWRAGSAEMTGLDRGCVDLVVAFQAFHWFDPEGALEEFHRVLRPGGRVALAWNQRDDADPFTGEWGSMVKELSGDHPADRRLEVTRMPFTEAGFSGVVSTWFRHEQELDLEGLIGRAQSTSYLPGDGEALDPMIARIRAIHARMADERGRVRFVYRTELRMATRG